MVVWAGDAERNAAERVVAGSVGFAMLAPPTTLRELASLTPVEPKFSWAPIPDHFTWPSRWKPLASDFMVPGRPSDTDRTDRFMWQSRRRYSKAPRENGETLSFGVYGSNRCRVGLRCMRRHPASRRLECGRVKQKRQADKQAKGNGVKGHCEGATVVA